MRRLFFMMFFVFSITVCANEIDHLNTTEDVVDFAEKVRLNFDEYLYTKFNIVDTEIIYKDLDCKEIIRDEEITNWQKVDLNNDGLTDLFFISKGYGYTNYGIIDKGNDVYKLVLLSGGSGGFCELAVPIVINNKNQLKIIEQRIVKNDTQVVVVDTLTFRFDEVVELNEEKGNYRIKSIEMKLSLCYGSCAVYNLSIQDNNRAVFTGIENVKKIGVHYKKMKKGTFKELKKMMNYIKIKEYDSKYLLSRINKQPITLIIRFKDGVVKEIPDFNVQRSYGLIAVYNKMLAIKSEVFGE